MIPPNLASPFLLADVGKHQIVENRWKKSEKSRIRIKTQKGRLKVKHETL